MQNENIMDKVDEMFEEDELFEEDFDMEEKNTLEKKAFKLGEKVANVTSSKAFKIGKTVVKIAMGAAAIGYAYKRGIDTGVNSVRAIEDSDDCSYDDSEFEEFMRNEEAAEEETVEE